MPHICSGKIAHVALKSHRDSLGAFDIGDVVIVTDESVLRILYREGSLSPDMVVDSTYFTNDKPAAEPKTRGRKSAAAGANRMVTESETRVDTDLGDGPVDPEIGGAS